MIPHFPLLGYRQCGKYTKGLPLIFCYITRNIRKRRGSKVNIEVPTFMDENTTIPPTIHMDAMGFGMGSCCLQVTFQAENIEESRILYDQLVVIAPYVVQCSIAMDHG